MILLLWSSVTMTAFRKQSTPVLLENPFPTSVPVAVLAATIACWETCLGGSKSGPSDIVGLGRVMSESSVSLSGGGEGARLLWSEGAVFCFPPLAFCCGFVLVLAGGALVVCLPAACEAGWAVARDLSVRMMKNCTSQL